MASNKITIAGLFLVLAAPALFGETQKGEPTQPSVAPLTATFVANEGFLLEAGGRKVLVDALFGDYPLYIDVSKETRAAVVAGTGPFAGIDLVLATHFHADHFDAGAVARFLAANPKAIFVSTPQAIAQLEGEKGYETLRPRIKAVLPEDGKRVELPELGLEVLNLHHGRDRKPFVQNLGFVIHLGPFKVLHVGDTDASLQELAAYDLPQDPIDLAMMAYWHLISEKWDGVIERTIQPRHVLAMHLEVKPEKSTLEHLKTTRPKVLIPRRELETVTLSPKSAGP